MCNLNLFKEFKSCTINVHRINICIDIISLKIDLIYIFDDSSFYLFQMCLLYFGLSLSIVGLVGGQTSQASSQAFWGEEKLWREEQVLQVEKQQEGFDQESLNSTSGSLEEEPWPLRECIAILGEPIRQHFWQKRPSGNICLQNRPSGNICWQNRP